jgi:hypothetical protein
MTSTFGQSQNPFEIKGRMQVDSVRAIQNLPAKKDSVRSTSKDKSQTAPDKQNIEIEAQKKKQQSDHNINSGQADAVQNPFEITATPKRTVDAPGETTSIKEDIVEDQKETKEPVIPSTIKKQGNFLFWVILFAFLILAVALSIDRWFVTKLFKGIFNYNLSNTMMRETSGIKFIILILLYFMFIIIVSIFAFLIFRYFTGIDNITYLYYSFAGVLSIYLIRHFSLFFLGIIFPKVQEAYLYNYSVVTFNAVTGIILIIPVLLMAFSASAIVAVAMYVGIILFGALFILRSLRGTLIAFRYINNQPIHFFLYLCAFEIIPLMVVYKILTDFV